MVLPRRQPQQAFGSFGTAAVQAAIEAQQMGNRANTLAQQPTGVTAGADQGGAPVPFTLNDNVTGPSSYARPGGPSAGPLAGADPKDMIGQPNNMPMSPGSLMNPAGTGTGTFNAEGNAAFSSDATTLLEPYAQEQGWSMEGGNRAMYGDEFQKADAAWELFSSGAVGWDLAAKEQFVRDYLGQATTPGGSFYTEEQVRAAVLNGPADSTFNQQMQSLPVDQQVQYLNTTYVNALVGTVPTPMLSARKAQLEQWGREYLAFIHTNPAGAGMGYQEWLRTTGKM